jgi:murein DD-endopeptidase MepM/ murein hydrolase activator NlpD
MLAEAAGLGSVAASDAVVAWLQAQPQIAPVLGERQSLPLTQLRFARPATGATYQLTELDPDKDMQLGGTVGLGSYLEDRAIYTDDHFISAFDRGWRRTLHLGIDLFDDALVPVYAPFDGIVESLVDTGMAQDYGPLLILRHEPAEGLRFYTLYGHLSRSFPEGIAVGAAVRAGQRIALLGAPDENGSWPPHLHFQLIVDLLGSVGNFPGVGEAGLRGFWSRLCPDPNLVLRLPVETAA